MSPVLPSGTIALSKLISNSDRHPGLQLDKFSEPDDQTAQKEALAVVSAIPGDATLLSALIERRRCANGAVAGIRTFRCATSGPLTLHLSRASALENAGICMHPLYGFVYLPASGLKGMARAYAETVWFPAQFGAAENGEPVNTDQQQRASEAWRRIEAVFGRAPNCDQGKMWKPKGLLRQPPEDNSAAGQIIFLDAWPTAWPRFIVDIVNNHHPNYYQAGDNDNAHPPGDWEDPNPVYFLAIPAGATFDFALAKRRVDVPDDLVKLASEWLSGALCHLGAGAKTAAGYGSFKLDAEAPVAEPARIQEAAPSATSRTLASIASFETTLELVTPAFLAGASQEAEDCDLRSATLRGLLRWWWRTMHAGFVDVATLRRMEALVWGDTRQGGALRVEVRRVKCPEPQKYSKRAFADMAPADKTGDYGIPGLDPQKTTQGLWYASYGMDDKGKPRWYLDAGSSWECRLTVRGGTKEATEKLLIEQGTAALWLLCRYGGVGAKSRKGFGSLNGTPFDGWTGDRCHAAAAEFRRTQGAEGLHQDRLAASPSLEQLLPETTARFDWPDVWDVLDQIGFAYQACAKKYAHCREKKALGLPRKIGRGPQDVQGKFQPTGAFAEHLSKAKNPGNARHASPVHFHVDRFDGAYVVRVVAFPAAGLPDLNTSRGFLTKFLGFLSNELERRCGLRSRQRRTAQNTAQNPPQHGKPTAAPGAVKVKFIGPHEKLTGACWVEETGKKKGLVKYGSAPDPLPPAGAEITVYATNQSLTSPEYRWDRPAPPPPPQRRGGPTRGRR
ncbi:MAG TPA: type III-B CRISPR module RAMP protein Cmr6 [Pirellulales bacterium]|nr:type III-B CRISPR module RAMP protein Cmr6 [Pirellulales bacterium]